MTEDLAAPVYQNDDKFQRTSSFLNHQLVIILKEENGVEMLNSLVDKSRQLKLNPSRTCGL